MVKCNIVPQLYVFGAMQAGVNFIPKEEGVVHVQYWG